MQKLSGKSKQATPQKCKATCNATILISSLKKWANANVVRQAAVEAWAVLGGPTGAIAPVTLSLDPPVAPRQGVCINNTMTVDE